MKGFSKKGGGGIRARFVDGPMRGDRRIISHACPAYDFPAVIDPVESWNEKPSWQLNVVAYTYHLVKITRWGATYRFWGVSGLMPREPRG